jgi:arsenate reductase (thioredoxin)
MNKKTVFFIFSVFIFSSFWSFGQKSKSKYSNQIQPIILFVCEHGAGRSAIAASYFNKIAQQQGLKYNAIFRGVDPQEALGISTKNGLIKDSIDIANLIPTRLSRNDIDKAYKIITLDCTLPDTLNKVDLRWQGIEMNGNYDISKNQIAPKVDSLIALLPKKKIKYRLKK